MNTNNEARATDSDRERPHTIPRVYAESGPEDRVRRRLNEAPFRDWYAELVERGEQWKNLHAEGMKENAADGDVGPQGGVLRFLSWKAYLGSDADAAAAAGRLVDTLLGSETAGDPYSKGLSRAAILRDVSTALDLCRPFWSPRDTQSVRDGVLRLSYSVAAGMGYQSNNSLASNWMGVRYGSIIAAAGSVAGCDTTGDEDGPQPGAPLLWEAQKRIFDHVAANVASDGWNAESMGYHLYGWSFVGPAMRYLRTVYDSADVLQRFGPHAIGSLASVLRTVVPISGAPGSTGIKPDFSDDNLNFGHLSLAVDAMHFDAPALRSTYRWFLESYRDRSGAPGICDDLATMLLCMPDGVVAENPVHTLGAAHCFPDSGVAVFRNQYQDENDIVVSVNAKQTPRRGHNGADTNALRLIGLGVPWIVGAGRTQEHEGQPGMRPSVPPKRYAADSLGSIEQCTLRGSDGGYLVSTGSCVGVEGLCRKMNVDYSGRTGVPALIVLAESSVNGERWRLVTPEFNSMEHTSRGLIFHAPGGSSMLVQCVYSAVTARNSGRVLPEIEVCTVRYGGETVVRNPGIQYRGEAYESTTVVDYFCGGRVVFVITLAERPEDHPDAVWADGFVYAGSAGVAYEATAS